ncbi:hypothetical protein GQR58_025940 [Nymphon striatum]|nr:hypothetical protein GQR58_025940 [Nymphon striatum]
MRMPIASSGQTITKEYYIKVLRRLTEGCGKMKAAAAADKCPDLAPCDFWPFPKIKSLLKERRFQSTDEIKENSTKELMKIPKEDFSNCFEKWKEHWEKCVMFQEEYLEGDFEGGFSKYICNRDEKLLTHMLIVLMILMIVINLIIKINKIKLILCPFPRFTTLHSFIKQGNTIQIAF